MALHLSKIAYGCGSVAALREWLESHAGEARTSTRYLPRRHQEMVGGSLYWIHEHTIVGRSPLLGFAAAEDNRWWIRLEPRLLPVMPTRKRAHQGWRYLSPDEAPRDLGDDEATGDLLPPALAGQLARLGLV